jgi:hypothetical protein
MGRTRKERQEMSEVLKGPAREITGAETTKFGV